MTISDPSVTESPSWATTLLTLATISARISSVMTVMEPRIREAATGVRQSGDSHTAFFEGDTHVEACSQAPRPQEGRRQPREAAQRLRPVRLTHEGPGDLVTGAFKRLAD